MDRDVFVGRERELADLERRLVDSRAIGGAVVFCEADAGMGKTALAAELARRAREQGFRVAWGACLEGEGLPMTGPPSCTSRAARARSWAPRQAGLNGADSGGHAAVNFPDGPGHRPVTSG
jgi:AAA ATPase domain